MLEHGRDVKGGVNNLHCLGQVIFITGAAPFQLDDVPLSLKAT
jgi:hypothetical protein